MGGAGPAPLTAPVPDLFTIGYEGLIQDQFLNLLSANGVSCILDVRAVPLSRKAGFSKNILAGSLCARGIGYAQDKRLGTPKPGRDAARRGRIAEMYNIFSKHMQTSAAQAGLADAIMLTNAHTVCLLCFERAPHDCHRSIVASLIHQATGQAIRHL